MKRTVALLVCVCLVLVAGCAARTPVLPAGAADECKALVEQLAGATMEGRGPGTAGLDRARDLVRGRLRAAGLKPGFVDGEFVQPLLLEVDGRSVVIHNVAGLQPGRGALSDQCVIVGAHYDHLGKGPPWLGIFAGADDNASGTAVMLVLAKQWAQRVKHDGHMTARRTLVFVGFSGEEHDLAGSIFFVAHPEQLGFDLKRTAAMVNFDMVGRLRDDTLWLFRTHGITWWQRAMDAAHQRTPQLQLKPLPLKISVGDHLSFANVGLPVLHLFTGLHADYHTPDDVAWKINYAGMARIVDFADGLLEELAYDPAYTGFANVTREAAAP